MKLFLSKKIIEVIIVISIIVVLQVLEETKSLLGEGFQIYLVILGVCVGISAIIFLVSGLFKRSIWRLRLCPLMNGNPSLVNQILVKIVAIGQFFTLFCFIT